MYGEDQFDLYQPLPTLPEDENPLLRGYFPSAQPNQLTLTSPLPELVPEPAVEVPEVPDKAISSLPPGYILESKPPAEEEVPGPLPEGFVPEFNPRTPDDPSKWTEFDKAGWNQLPDIQKKQFLVGGQERKLEADVLARRNEIRDEEFKAPENWATLSREEKTKAQEDFAKQKEVSLRNFDTTETEKGHGDIVDRIRGEIPVGTSPGAAVADELSAHTRAAVWSPSQGVWDVFGGVVNTLAHGEALARGIDPKDTDLHNIAVGARQNAADMVGPKGDELYANVLRGLGSSLTFAPSAIAGRNAGVAAMGFVSRFGDGYFEAHEMAEKQGREISEAEAYARAFASGGIGATEGVPLSRGIERLDKFTGGAMKRVLAIGAEGAEEFAQEYGANVMQDVYDKLTGLTDKQWGEIFGEIKGPGIAGFTGLLTALLMHGGQIATRGPRTQQAEADAAVKAGAPVIPPPLPVTPPPLPVTPPPLPGAVPGAAPPPTAVPGAPPVAAPPAVGPPPVTAAPPPIELGPTPPGAAPSAAPPAAPPVPVAPAPEPESAMVAQGRLEAINSQLAYGGPDPVQRQALEAEKVKIQVQLDAREQVGAAKAVVQNLEASGAPATAKAFAQTSAEDIPANTQATLEELVAEIPAAEFAPEAVPPPLPGAPAAPAAPAVPAAAAAPPGYRAAGPAPAPAAAAPPAAVPGGVPVPEIQLPAPGAPAVTPAASAAAPGVTPPVAPGVTPTAVAPGMAEETAIRTGIKSQEAVITRPSQEMAQYFGDLDVDVPSISLATGQVETTRQNAAQALSELKQDHTAITLLINCLS